MAQICRVCTWTALLLFLLAIFNACVIINRFTRIAGETFGMLIAVLFIQEAIKVIKITQGGKNFETYSLGLLFLSFPCCDFVAQGLVSEFNVPKNEDPSKVKYEFQWMYTNGLLAIVFSFGLLYTALKSRKARSWWCGTGG